MKIFISHSSKDANYGKALVELLTSIGIPHNSITFTSDPLYGIPSGQNIFRWLKDKISEKPFVIYLLSSNYFSSVACLNEMGAAWMIENEHVSIFTPDFDINTQGFRDGVLDPREMGFRLNDRDRVIQFAEQIKLRFDLQTGHILIGRACDKLLNDVNEKAKTGFLFKKQQSTSSSPVTTAQNEVPQRQQDTSAFNQPTVAPMTNKKLSPEERFFEDFSNGKLKDEEILFIHYASESARFSFGVGWRTDEEKDRIRRWEDLNEYGDKLSKGYEIAISRFEIRNLTEVTGRTSHGNPRQVDFVAGFKNRLLDLPESLHKKAEEIIREDLAAKKVANDEIPF